MDGLHIAIHGFIDAIAHALESMDTAIEAIINGANKTQADAIN